MMSSTFVAQLGWVLLDFVWQGALVGCATASALLVLRNARPESRYAVACAGLLLCLLWPATELVLRVTGDSEGAALATPLEALVARDDAGGVAGWTSLLHDNLHLVVGAWACCAAALGLRLALGLAWVERAARTHRGDAGWQAKLAGMATRFGIDRPVTLRIVDQLASPVTAGWLKPVVLVPAALLTHMPPQLLEALLAHELAHVRRCDYLVNLAQSAIETVLFYHPAVWWISSRIRIEREQIADDFAARQLGEPRRLALALSELERLQFSTHHLAQAANGGDLMSRIKRLVRPDTQALNWKAAIPALGLAAMTAAVVAHAAPATQGTQPDVLAHARFDTCKKPEYPADSLKLKHEGTVTIAFLVGTNGKVKEARIDKTSGHVPLDETARVALAKCSFKPATLKGRPVEAWTNVQYVWTLG